MRRGLVPDATRHNYNNNNNKLQVGKIVLRTLFRHYVFCNYAAGKLQFIIMAFLKHNCLFLKLLLCSTDRY